MGTEPDARSEEILQRLRRLEGRVAALEESAGRAGFPLDKSPTRAGAEVAGGGRTQAAGSAGSAMDILPLIGRTLFIFAGAFLLRAATGSGLLPPTVGSTIGVLYAGIWILLADRHAGRGMRASAGLYGLAAAGIAFPLLWEATASFRFLSPVLAALALAAIASGGFVVATRHRLGVLAAAYTLGGAATALALALSTKLWPLYVGEVLALTVALMALSPKRRWPVLEWLLGAVSIAVLVLMTMTWSVSPPERVAALFSVGQLLALQLGWVLAVMLVLSVRTLRRGSAIDAAEILQGLTALAAGFGGALVVSGSPEIGTASVGWAGLLLAVGCYGASFAIADSRVGRRNFVFYSSVALLVTLIASMSLLADASLTFVLALVSLVTAVVGARRGRATLTLHAAVYIAAAAWSAGMAGASLRAMVGSDVPARGWIDPEVLVVLAVAALASWLPVATHGRTWGRYSRFPKVLVELVLLLGVIAVVVTLASEVLFGGATAARVAALDALRSGVVALSAVAVAWLGRWPRWPEAAWMVYPILGLGAAKLLLVDLPDGTPLSLVFSLLFYGGALIVAPRLHRAEAGRQGTKTE